jgi:hypothetical protein
MGDKEMHTKFLSENLKRRHHLEDMGIDGILKWILNKQGAKPAGA